MLCFSAAYQTEKRSVFVFNYFVGAERVSLKNGLGMRKTIPPTLYQQYGLDMVGVK